MPSRLNNLELLIKKNSDDESYFTDYEECKRCAEYKKSTCCMLCPCEFSPNDLIEVTKDNILKLLDTGYVVLDCYEGDLEEIGFKEYKRVWFLRMRAKNDLSGVSFGWGGCCSALEDGKGCMLEFAYRPYYGRSTLPCNKVKEWDTQSTKFRSCAEWRPYHDLLEEIAVQVDPLLHNCV